MKRVENPPNPYESAYREYLEEPPPVRVEVFEETAHSIIAANDSPDIPFTYSVNPYRGCQHGCAYCYARPYHEYLGMGAGTDFESKLVVKVNAADLLDRELSRSKYRGQELNFSGITDCYQPLEAVYGLTRRCLEICLKHGNAAAIVTKGFLVARDVDVLSALHAGPGAWVFVSIPFHDPEMARAIEPGAPPPSRRFEALRRLSAAGIPTGVMVAPIIPGLNDSQVPHILEAAAEAGASSASYTAVRLPGSVEPVFLNRLEAALPLRYVRVKERIRDMRDGELNDSRFFARMTGTGRYWDSVRQLFDIHRQRLGLSPHSCESASRTGPPRVQEAAYTQLGFDFDSA